MGDAEVETMVKGFVAGTKLAGKDEVRFGRSIQL